MTIIKNYFLLLKKWTEFFVIPNIIRGLEDKILHNYF